MLHDLELGSSGRYTCEVSSEAPRFKTVDGTSHMKVIDLPDDIPILRQHSIETTLSFEIHTPKYAIRHSPVYKNHGPVLSEISPLSLNSKF